MHLNGYAIQCRVTTEDPANNFAPDTGKITAYRSAGGFGVRLDGGNAGTGAEISPYYDSLLVKVTTWDNTFPAVCRKAARAINEVHVRGVKTNIPFVTNILAHPTFMAGGSATPSSSTRRRSCLTSWTWARDRATKVLQVHRQDPGGQPRRASGHKRTTPPASRRPRESPGPTASSSCWTPRAPRP